MSTKICLNPKCKNEVIPKFHCRREKLYCNKNCKNRHHSIKQNIEYPEKKKRWDTEKQLKKLYNITIEDYNLMFKNQNGLCSICGRHQSELVRKLQVDHDHVNGKIRGLLCSRCNVGLGSFKDSIGLFTKAIEYIQKNREVKI